jgi:hypothetical protein
MVKLKRLNEASFGGMSHGDFTRGIPFYGTKGDFSFTVGRSQFTPGISIKQTPLTDMSVKGDPGYSPLDMELAKLKLYFKPGDRVRGTIVNSHIDSEKGKVAIGKIVKLLPNYSNGSVRCWIRNPKNHEIVEVYVDSIEKIYESSRGRALSFANFINS